VQRHHGAVTVSSEPGQGSCFSILLPAVEPEKANSSTAAPERATRPGRILVVDDEQLVRELTRNLLEEQGHTVAAMPDGASAVEYYRNNWREIDLVVLDLIMPKMDGRTGARVLLVSGYIADADGLILPQDRSVAFLQKPFNLSDLQRGVARLLTGP
jgi:DNA-binding response OmpR family regulator